MRIVLLGPPGSGKAKFCELIGKYLQIPVLTSTSVLQRAAAEDSELGRLAADAINTSRVSDELLLALLRVQLSQANLADGFVLVDFPRNAAQADVLDNILDSLGRPLDLVLYVHVDPDELMERLVGRITCEHCGAQYNQYINPPTVEGVCDVCGTRVSRRPDDYEETISNRLRIYEGQTGPLTQYYGLHGKLQQIPGDAGVQAVWPEMRKLIDSIPRAAVFPEAPAPANQVTSTVESGITAASVGATAKSRDDLNESGQPQDVSVTTATDLDTTGNADAEPAPVLKEKATKKEVTKKHSPDQAVTSKEPGKKKIAKGQTTKKPAAKKKRTVKQAATRGEVATAKRVAKKATVAKQVAAGKKTPASKKSAAKRAAAKKPVVVKKAAAGKVARPKASKNAAGVGKAAKPLAKKAKPKTVAKGHRGARSVATKKKTAAKPAVVGKKPSAKRVAKSPPPARKKR